MLVLGPHTAGTVEVDVNEAAQSPSAPETHVNATDGEGVFWLTGGKVVIGAETGAES